MDADSVELGASISILMEGAGQEMGLEIFGLYDPGNVRVHVLCGPGNNGGDGLVVARVLLRHGFSVQVAVLADEERLRSDDLLGGKLRLLELAGGEPKFYSPKNLKVEALLANLEDLEGSEGRQPKTLMVDALFGSGLNRSLKPPYSDLIRGVNVFVAAAEPSPSNPPKVEVVALDMPSGLSRLEAEEDAPIVRADRTLTLQAIKDIFLYPKALPYLGTTTILPIDFPPSVFRQHAFVLRYLPDEVEGYALPTKSPFAHKRSYGRSVVVAGSSLYPGSALLAVNGALSVGCASLEVLAAPAAATRLPPQAIPKQPFQKGFFSSADLEPHMDFFASAAHVLIGPGLGLEEGTTEALGRLLKALPKGKNIVVDADGIAHLKRLLDAGEFSADHGHRILLTPHFGEFRRLVDATKTPALSPTTYLDALKSLAKDFRLLVLVKDCLSLLQEPNGELSCVGEPNAFLSKAGSGDVFAGMILGMLSQTNSIREAALAASVLLMRRGFLIRERYGASCPISALYDYDLSS